MAKTKVGTLEIAYTLHGRGEPLLLISGLGYGQWFWHTIVPELARNYQVITFDNRGAGDSGKPDGPYSTSQMAADTIGLLDALGIHSAHILGHSLGALILQDLVVQRPGLARKLIFASASHGGKSALPMAPAVLELMMNRTGSLQEMVMRGLAVASAPGFAERHPERVQRLLEYRLTHPVPPSQYAAQVQAGAATLSLTEADIATRMAAIQVPALLLSGEQDQVVPVANSTLMARKIRNARVQTIPGTGHIFPIENPEATVRAIQDFLIY